MFKARKLTRLSNRRTKFSLFIVGALVTIVSRMALAEELPTKYPWKYEESVDFALNQFCGLSVFASPAIGLLNTRPLFKSAFSDNFTPTATVRNWIYFSQSTAFAGLTSCATRAYVSTPSLILTTALGGVVGYYLTRSALQGNKLAAVTSLVVPQITLFYFIIWIS
jgi:hypothetical protein